MEEVTVRIHTERKSVEEPGAPGNLFTRKLAQLFGNNHLPVLPTLDFVPIRHVQDKPALETENMNEMDTMSIVEI